MARIAAVKQIDNSIVSAKMAQIHEKIAEAHRQAELEAAASAERAALQVIHPYLQHICCPLNTP
eukprot:1107516-Prorocentrum_minimum.AAC.1